MSWWPSLLCIVADLAGVGSMGVAVGNGDRWQVKCDMWQVTPNTKHVTDTYTGRLQQNILGRLFGDTMYIFSSFIYFGLGAIICTCLWIQCLPYAGFSFYLWHFLRGEGNCFSSGDWLPTRQEIQCLPDEILKGSSLREK